MLESELQRQVIAQAQELNLRVFHSTDARRDVGPGYPDLTIVGPGGIAFIELKTETGAMSRQQFDWRQSLIDARAEYRLYRPQQLHDGTIRTFLVSLAQEPSEALYEPYEAA
jgi:hypothetical protein